MFLSFTSFPQRGSKISHVSTSRNAEKNNLYKKPGSINLRHKLPGIIDIMVSVAECKVYHGKNNPELKDLLI